MPPEPIVSHKLTNVEWRALASATWADDAGCGDQHQQLIAVAMHERDTRMAHSRATGESLVSNGQLGADIIRLAAGEGFVPHTHPGDHLLIIIGGQGTVAIDGEIRPTEPGQIVLIDGGVPHAVGAVTDHVILAVGSPHMPVDSSDRMTLVEYRAITADMGRLRCTICGIESGGRDVLHELGCAHCPCVDCNQLEEPR